MSSCGHAGSPLDGDAAAEHEALLQFLYVCPHGMAQFAADGTILMLNPAFACLTMPLLAPGAMFTNLLDVLGPYAPELRGMLRCDRPEHGSLCDGMQLHLTPASDGIDPRVLSLTVVRMDSDRHMAVLSDVSAQVARERRLRESDAWFAALIQGADDYAMLGLDAGGRISEWNASGERLFGRDACSVLGVSASGLVLPAGSGGDGALASRLAAVLHDGWHLDEGWRTRRDGSRFWGTCIVSALSHVDEGGTRYLMVVRDTTEQRSAAHELRRALTTDHLTGASNRRTFFERGAEMIRRARRERAPLSILMVDIDHFKSVNDRHGHAVGDDALRSVAAALGGSIPDGALLGRLGGEEFGVLLPGTDVDAVEMVAETLRARIAETVMRYDAFELQVTASFGSASLGPEVANLESLLAVADAALYRAKRGGRNRVCVSNAPHRNACASRPELVAGAPGVGTADTRGNADFTAA